MWRQQPQRNLSFLPFHPAKYRNKGQRVTAKELRSWHLNCNSPRAGWRNIRLVGPGVVRLMELKGSRSFLNAIQELSRLCEKPAKSEWHDVGNREALLALGKRTRWWRGERSRIDCCGMSGCCCLECDGVVGKMKHYLTQGSLL